MARVNSRAFLGGVLAVGATTFSGKASRSVRNALTATQSSNVPTSRIDILVNEPIGTINPDIYGHFAEYLGGVVYDGIWENDPNHFGTNEFARFCQLVDAQPYLAANVRGLGAQEFYIRFSRLFGCVVSL